MRSSGPPSFSTMRPAAFSVLSLRSHLRRRLGRRALGIGNRGAAAEIVPNKGDHLECDECGACIDICPVGALTSGTYRYKTRPWEMEHVGTVCTHCSNGCKTTLGIRNGEIMRANNRDRVGREWRVSVRERPLCFRFQRTPGPANQPLVRTNGSNCDRSRGRRRSRLWPRSSLSCGQERKIRRDWLESHEQRRKLPAAEVRAQGIADE
jgi:ferredoxin